MRINKYQAEQNKTWNKFIANSKQGTFLLDRGYMDYHSDRFFDHSLMFYDQKNELVAVLPANIKDNILYSHQGLSYGGFISTNEARTSDVLQCFEALNSYAKENKISKLIYKRIPAIYQKYPSDEDLYALFRNDAKLIRRDIAYVIDMNNPIAISRNKKRYLKNFGDDYEIKASQDYKKFHEILEEALSIHDAKPIHSEAELKLLTERFPKNISLYQLSFKQEALAFCWIFSTPNTIHIQNMVASKFARDNHFIDYFYSWILANLAKDYKYFSFGISTEKDGRYLNEGLAAQKESFGGRGICHDFFELEFNK